MLKGAGLFPYGVGFTGFLLTRAGRWSSLVWIVFFQHPMHVAFWLSDNQLVSWWGVGTKFLGLVCSQVEYASLCRNLSDSAATENTTWIIWENTGKTRTNTNHTQISVWYWLAGSFHCWVFLVKIASFECFRQSGDYQFISFIYL